MPFEAPSRAAVVRCASVRGTHGRGPGEPRTGQVVAVTLTVRPSAWAPRRRNGAQLPSAGIRRRLVEAREAGLIVDVDPFAARAEGFGLLLRTLTVPAVVLNKYGDVVAANALARELSPDMTPGVNQPRSLFTDPAARPPTGWPVPAFARRPPCPES